MTIDPIFSTILQQHIDAINANNRKKSIELNADEIQIMIDVLEEYHREVKSLDALQFQPSDTSATVSNLLKKLIKL